MNHGKFRISVLLNPHFLGLVKGFFSHQIVNGYFVHFFAPPDLTRVPKNVVFVIDRSGSMSGTKMQQVGRGVTY